MATPDKQPRANLADIGRNLLYLNSFKSSVAQLGSYTAATLALPLDSAASLQTSLQQLM
jgi:hypothetical protein